MIIQTRLRRSLYPKAEREKWTFPKIIILISLEPQ